MPDAHLYFSHAVAQDVEALNTTEGVKLYADSPYNISK